LGIIIIILHVIIITIFWKELLLGFTLFGEKREKLEKYDKFFFCFAIFFLSLAIWGDFIEWKVGLVFLI